MMGTICDGTDVAKANHCVMKLQAFHKNVLVQVTAALLFAASSGFTAILHYCTTAPVSCCSTEASSRSKDCESTNQHSSTQSFRGTEICHTNTVVGGLTTNPAVMDKESQGSQKKTETLPVLDSHASSSSIVTSQVTSVPLLSERAFLPSVEKYVLFQTFLI